MRLKRAYTLWLNTWRARISSLRIRFDQYRCGHVFRPARINNKPGRVCRICEKSEELTQEEFFAIFGERNWQL